MAQAQKARDAGWLLGIGQAVHLAAAAVMSDRGRDAFTDFQEHLLDTMKD